MTAPVLLGGAKASLKLGHSFDRLRRTFTDIMDNFRKIRMEKEEHY